MLRTITDKHFHWPINFRAHSIKVEIRSDFFDLPGWILHPMLRSVTPVFLSRDGEKDYGTSGLCLRLRHHFRNRQHLGDTECVVRSAVVDAIVRGETVSIVVS